MSLFHRHVWNVSRVGHMAHASEIWIAESQNRQPYVEWSRLFCSCRCGKVRTFSLNGKWEKEYFKEGIYKP